MICIEHEFDTDIVIVHTGIMNMYERSEFDEYIKGLPYIIDDGKTVLKLSSYDLIDLMYNLSFTTGSAVTYDVLVPIPDEELEEVIYND